jgi:hypothetical protein
MVPTFVVWYSAYPLSQRDKYWAKPSIASSPQVRAEGNIDTRPELAPGAAHGISH